jgi:hypothetical protein
VGRHVRFRDAAELSEAGLQAGKTRQRSAPVARDAGLPKGANEITEELKKLWLSEES